MSISEHNNTTIEKILEDHQDSHGDFSQVGVVAQTLKRIMRNTPNWEKLNPPQKEALEMDALKTARILCGDHAFCDHWDDKAGYAKLGSRACAGTRDDAPTVPVESRPEINRPVTSEPRRHTTGVLPKEDWLTPVPVPPAPPAVAWGLPKKKDNELTPKKD